MRVYRSMAVGRIIIVWHVLRRILFSKRFQMMELLNSFFKRNFEKLKNKCLFIHGNKNDFVLDSFVLTYNLLREPQRQQRDFGVQ